MLEVAAKVENPDTNNSCFVANSTVDKLIFKPCDIISMVARDVDADYAIRDSFQTDSAISARINGISQFITFILLFCNCYELKDNKERKRN